ncbi:hypothetical protein [Paenibacillus lautus]|uniref:hypothetical protein n=1 Tax=Paenibacillus lautus TaxID=1401 RepID=UPI003D2B5BBF
MIKKLVMNEPVLKTYPKHSNVTSILANHVNFEEWLYSNHIQLFCAIYENSTKYDTYLDIYEPLHRVYYPLLECKSIKKEIISACSIDPSAFAISNIDEGYYVYACVDIFYIPEYQSNKHKNHDIFVFGYDDDEQTFFVADFFKGHYSCQTISFDCFSAAVNSTFRDENQFKDIQMLKTLDNPVHSVYCFDIDNVLIQLKDYLGEYNSSLRYREFEAPLPDTDNRTWGLGVYDSLISSISQEKVPKVTRRSLHALYEHKKLMVGRVKYLLDNEYITEKKVLEKHKIIETKSLILRNIFMKSMARSFDKNPIVSKLKELQNMDNEALAELVYLLEC